MMDGDGEEEKLRKIQRRILREKIVKDYLKKY